MDAYDIIFKLQNVWREAALKNSGMIDKAFESVDVVVNTSEGCRKVVGVKWIDELKKIELVLDNE